MLQNYIYKSIRNELSMNDIFVKFIIELS